MNYKTNRRVKMGIEQEIEEYKKEGTWWYLNLAGEAPK